MENVILLYRIFSEAFIYRLILGKRTSFRVLNYRFRFNYNIFSTKNTIKRTYKYYSFYFISGFLLISIKLVILVSRMLKNSLVNLLSINLKNFQITTFIVYTFKEKNISISILRYLSKII